MRNVHNSVIIMYKKREEEGICRRLDLLRICVTPMKFQIFITKNGYGDLVVMSIEAYEEMVERMAMNGAIYDAEMEFALSGETHEARSALKQLRRKHLG